MGKTNMIKRILAIDIGNTAATVGFYEGGRLIDFGSIYYNDIPKYAIKLLKSGKDSHLDIIISSVYPEITKKVKSSFEAIKGQKIWVVGKNLPIKILHNYNNYNGLGCDRKVSAYGAVRMYRLPMLIIDYGTAITFDYIDSKGFFQGGMIIPGLRLSAESLFRKTALLPQVSIERPKHLIGRNTKTSILSGIFFGYGALLDGLIERICEQRKIKPKIILKLKINEYYKYRLLPDPSNF
jgi:type III pantothenate kinase